MARVRFSPRAEADLLGIAAYTRNTWSENQTVRYLEDLEKCCRMLADNPTAGRQCETIRPGLRRIEHSNHVIFYRRDAKGILISRILHERVLPNQQRF